MTTTSEKYILEVLEVVSDTMKLFDEVVTTITKQKAFATIDYGGLNQDLEVVFKNARATQTELKKRDIQIDYFDEMLVSLRTSIDAFGIVFDGLKSKAEATGKYGWLRYRKDLKAFWETYDEFQRRRALFADSFQPVKKVTVTAMLTGVGVYEPITKQIEMSEIEYEKMRDEDGIVYLFRHMEQGKPVEFLIDKETWYNSPSIRDDYVR